MKKDKELWGYIIIYGIVAIGLIVAAWDWMIDALGRYQTEPKSAILMILILVAGAIFIVLIIYNAVREK